MRARINFKHSAHEKYSHTPEDREKKISNHEEVNILIDNLLLAIKMNISLLSVRERNNHMAKYVYIPESWRSKNYAFRFLEVVNTVVKNEIINDIKMAHFHTLIVDESKDISTTKCLILYFKLENLINIKLFWWDNPIKDTRFLFNFFCNFTIL